MSLQNKIETEIRKVIRFNKIAVKSLEVKPEKIITERNYKEGIVYKIMIGFSGSKNPQEHFELLYNWATFRFKIYRKVYDRDTNSLNFYMKQRSEKALRDIFKK